MRADECKPWVVCCLRAGTAAVPREAKQRGASGRLPDLWDLKGLRRQLSDLLLDDVLQMSGGEFTVVRPIALFRERYGKLLKGFGFDPEEEDYEDPLAVFRAACSALLTSFAYLHLNSNAPVHRLESFDGAEHFTVGASSIYLTAKLLDNLERRLGNSQPTLLTRYTKKQTKDENFEGVLQRREHRWWNVERGSKDDLTEAAGSKRRHRSGRGPASYVVTQEPDGMYNDHKASLHADLARMAALMRIAKEKEVRGREVQALRDEILGRLQQECDSWREESSRLLQQARMLDKQVASTKGVSAQEHSSDESERSFSHRRRRDGARDVLQLSGVGRMTSRR